TRAGRPLAPPQLAAHVFQLLEEPLQSPFHVARSGRTARRTGTAEVTIVPPPAPGIPHKGFHHPPPSGAAISGAAPTAEAPRTATRAAAPIAEATPTRPATAVAT